MNSHKKNKNSGDESRKRERSRNKETGKKSVVVSKQEDVKSEEGLYLSKASNNNVYKISIVSKSKVLLENFVVKELNKM